MQCCFVPFQRAKRLSHSDHAAKMLRRFLLLLFSFHKIAAFLACSSQEWFSPLDVVTLGPRSGGGGRLWGGGREAAGLTCLSEQFRAGECRRARLFKFTQHNALRWKIGRLTNFSKTGTAASSVTVILTDWLTDWGTAAPPSGWRWKKLFMIQ